MNLILLGRKFYIVLEHWVSTFVDTFVDTFAFNGSDFSFLLDAVLVI